MQATDQFALRLASQNSGRPTLVPHVGVEPTTRSAQLKQSKKRKSWAMTLPEPKTNIPPG